MKDDLTIHKYETFVCLKIYALTSIVSVDVPRKVISMVENDDCTAAVVRAKVPKNARNMMRMVISAVGD